MTAIQWLRRTGILVLMCAAASLHAQVPPSRSELAQYKGLFAAALANHSESVNNLIFGI